MNALAAVIYPTAILAAGMGFTVAVARLGAVTAPLAGAALVARKVAAPEFMLAQLAPLAVCAGAALVLRARYRRQDAN